ncbi:hypothetical protein LshimejAT787_0200380 [Lyophyllum shimeji]|uniref:Uncharacterized protein n=1 Tax=Lyophyllum shimeji TaxID=47721 RepID=A0A9P3PFH2_LYOSH|nr:hypothetical protein LshimejAT787_0200380 [Lyophyllum shimeji]
MTRILHRCSAAEVHGAKNPISSPSLTTPSIIVTSEHEHDQKKHRRGDSEARYNRTDGCNGTARASPLEIMYSYSVV